MDLKDIKAIVDLMKKNSISEFELEKGQEFKIRLKRSANGGHGPLEEVPTPIYLPPGTPVPTDVGDQLSLERSYRAPVERSGPEFPSVPPQTIIVDPVHTAVCACLDDGAPPRAVGVQVSDAGS